MTLNLNPFYTEHYTEHTEELSKLYNFFLKNKDKLKISLNNEGEEVFFTFEPSIYSLEAIDRKNHIIFNFSIDFNEDASIHDSDFILFSLNYFYKNTEVKNIFYTASLKDALNIIEDKEISTNVLKLLTSGVRNFKEYYEENKSFNTKVDFSDFKQSKQETQKTQEFEYDLIHFECSRNGLKTNFPLKINKIESLFNVSYQANIDFKTDDRYATKEEAITKLSTWLFKMSQVLNEGLRRNDFDGLKI